jgi:hypothetical protein
VRYGFIARHRSIWPVRMMCRLLSVSHGGFHDGLSVRRVRVAWRMNVYLGSFAQASHKATVPTAVHACGAICTIGENGSAKIALHG